MSAKKLNDIKKIYVGILLCIFGGIVLHAPISVALETLCPDYALLIKSWKEILMLIAGLILMFLLIKTKKTKLLRDPIVVAIGVYALLHLLLLIFNFTTPLAALAGLAIDLRYMLYFVLVYMAMRIQPECRSVFIKVGAVGALVALVFAVLQVFVLPPDILKYIGYSKDTISPYLTIDLNQDFIRINSTLRGPNPLGVYSGVVLAIVAAYVVKFRAIKAKPTKWLLVILTFGAVVGLWASYSRSALVGAVVAVTIVFAVGMSRKISAKSWAAIGIVAAVMLVGLFAARDTTFVSNVVLHENPAEGNTLNSNEGHAESVGSGLMQMVTQPLGTGIGSTGSASLYTDNPTIIESQYLFVSHEVGWLGLILFVSIFVAILIKLWDLRRDWLALGVFASGVGLAIVGLVLPVWVDDTVSIVWWGLAAIALFSKDRDIIKS